MWKSTIVLSVLLLTGCSMPLPKCDVIPMPDALTNHITVPSHPFEAKSSVKDVVALAIEQDRVIKLANADRESVRRIQTINETMIKDRCYYLRKP